jgi:hypothetical protein
MRRLETRLKWRPYKRSFRVKKYFLSSFLYKNNHLKERLIMETNKVTLSYDGLAGQAK